MNLETQPLTRRDWLLGTSLGLALPALGQETAQDQPSPAARTVLLLRHAETSGDTRAIKDPPLSEEGLARAEGWAELLGGAGVTHLFTSEYLRTQRTVMPLAKAMELDVEVISARDPRAQVKRLVGLPAGSVAVVAGHSNTTPGLVLALGGRFPQDPDAPGKAPQLAHDQHGRLFVVTGPAPGGKALASLELRT